MKLIFKGREGKMKKKASSKFFFYLTFSFFFLVAPLTAQQVAPQSQYLVPDFKVHLHVTASCQEQRLHNWMPLMSDSFVHSGVFQRQSRSLKWVAKVPKAKVLKATVDLNGRVVALAL